MTGIQSRFNPVVAGKTLAVFGLNASHRAAGNDYDNPTAFIGGSKTHSEYLENRTQIQGNVDFLAPKYSTTKIEIGGDFQHVDNDYLVAGSFESQTHTRYMLNLGVSEYLSFWEDSFQVSLGLRMDWDVSEKPLFSPHAGILYRPIDELELWFSSAMGERYPSFDERYYHTEHLRGRDDLKPQRSILNELGIAYHPADWLIISAVGFYHLHRELIRFMPVTSYLYEARNIPESFARGFDFRLESKFWRGFSLRMDYAFTDARTGDGYAMPTAARHQVHASLMWDDDVWHAAILTGYATEIPRNMTETSFIPARFRLGVEASMKLYRGLRLSVSIQNLLNDMRSEDVLQRPLPGRHAWIGLEYD